MNERPSTGGRYVAIHRHFYQPPRENPWTDEMPREPSAAPYHDWNARIHAESYRSNAFARIHDGTGRITSIVNNYERLSFNFGPTRARWIGRHDPEVEARLRAADGVARARTGKGGGIAAEPGSVQGLILAVEDIDAARDDLISRGVEVTEVDESRPPGFESLEGRSYFATASFSDPDGNGWQLQEITTRIPGREWED